MKRLSVLAALIAMVFCGNAAAASFDCLGPPAEYVTKYDQVRGQLKNSRVGYPEKRVWIEWQSWLTPTTNPPTAPGHHSEHLHFSACVPQGVQLGSANGQSHMDIMFKFHNVADYKVTDIAGSFVTQNGSLGAFSPAARAAAIPDLDAAMQLSGGLATTTAFASLQLQPTQTNGIKEARMGLTVERNGIAALVESWKIDARWYLTDNYAGLPAVTPLVPAVRYIRSRTIVDFFNTSGVLKSDYHHSGACGSEAWTRDTIMAPKPAVEDACLRVTDGGADAALEINPDHHVHPDFLGVWHAEFFMRGQGGQGAAGDAIRMQPVPYGSLGLSTTKVHKLVFLSHEAPECQLAHPPNPCPPNMPNWTNVLVLPFKVQ